MSKRLTVLFRVNESNIIDAWKAANATENKELITICLPVVQKYLGTLIETPRLLKVSEPLGASRIISTKPRFKSTYSISSKVITS